MKAKKHIIVLVALALYGLGMPLYQYLVNGARLNDLLLTWGVMAVIIVLLYLIYSRMEKLREKHQFEDAAKEMGEDFDDDDPGEDAYRLPPDNK
ncbi:MAG: hypothetical protein IKP81_02420 [Paludibacteraceae bacterium]|nr:hypothetical protein [Paludibacteraceae bacterium]MBP3716816.1 hypothetical protein [Paludibacteraceae bacterium]MBR6103894.1 hypothetical protein [Paludibacteraceae bacterium]